MEDAMNFVYERNNYFTGKILSAKDFNMEQEYFNHKRWLLNQYNLGSGILYGLDVIKSGEMRQEECVTVKPGIAIDSSGREIIIRETVNQVLSELDSFSRVKNAGSMYLCLEYTQEEKDAAISVGDKSGRNYNKIREGYKFVLESEPPALLNGASRLMYNVREIYKDDKVVIWHKSPKYVNPGKGFECSFIISRRVKNVRVKLDYDVDTRNLNKGTPEVHFECPDRSVKTEFEEKYKLEAKDTGGAICFENLKVYVGDKVYSPDVEDISVSIESEDLSQKLLKDYFHEEISEKENTGRNKICLAKILLTTVDCALGTKFHIDAVKDTIFTHYIYPQFLQRVTEGGNEDVIVEEKPVEVKEERCNRAEEVKEVPLKETETFSTGVFSVLAKDVYKKVYYSDEINHGLGPGNVQLIAGLEEHDNNVLSNIQGMDHAVYSGDIGVFNKSGYAPLCSGVSIGMVLYPQKGTFRIGVSVQGGSRLKDRIWIRWWASKG